MPAEDPSTRRGQLKSISEAYFAALANREALVEEVVAWIGQASGSSRLKNAP